MSSSSDIRIRAQLQTVNVRRKETGHRASPAVTTERLEQDGDYGMVAQTQRQHLPFLPLSVRAEVSSCEDPRRIENSSTGDYHTRIEMTVLRRPRRLIEVLVSRTAIGDSVRDS